MRKKILIISIFVVLVTTSFLLHGEIPSMERAALIVLYKSTGGDNWTDNSGWKTSPLHSDGFAMPGTEGSWFGITVNNDNVEKIILKYNNLQGTIPAVLGGLGFLTTLELNSNQLSGSVPSSFIYLNLLTHLDIGYNALFADDEVLNDFLNSRNPEWESTQTIPPTGLSAASLSATSVEVSWTPIVYTGDSGGYLVYYSSVSGTGYTLFGTTSTKSASKMTVTGLDPNKTYYFVVQSRTDPHTNNLNTVTSNFSREVTIYGPGIAPEIALNRTRLNFGYIIGGHTPPAQTFRILNSGGGRMYWYLVCWKSGITISPFFGNGDGLVEVQIDPVGVSVGSVSGEIEVWGDFADNSPQLVQINLTVKSASQNLAPFGSLSTPTGNPTVSGSVPVTGWALDDVNVESVEIYRDPVSGEDDGLVYLGDAVFVEGARPDLEAAYPDYPNNYRAGWGYMMLSNFLPNGGNGTFTLYAIARDAEGKETTLGSTSIVCDNANAVNPFGTIDTPEQGGTVSGSNFKNHGWVLTPQPNMIPLDGSTITVFIDGVAVGHPAYNIYRSDIAELFPGYANSNGAHGRFTIDTTAYENGVHSISWGVIDNAGNAAGIGSRYFTVNNSQSTRMKSTVATSPFNPQPCGLVGVMKGFKRNAEPRYIHPDNNGNIYIEIKELERLEIRVGRRNITHAVPSLPIGSTFDRENGIFYWQPGVGFIGDYTFVLTSHDETGIQPLTINVKILPRFLR